METDNAENILFYFILLLLVELPQFKEATPPL